MRSQSAAPACTQRPSRKLLLIGGFTVPAIVLGSFLGATPAFAANSTANSKGQLQTAFGTAGSSPDTVTLGRNLNTDGAADDVLVLGATSSPEELILDLNGFTLAVDRIEVAAGSSLTVEDRSAAHGGRLLIGQPASTLQGDDHTGIVLGSGATFTDDGAAITAAGSDGNAGIGGDDAHIVIKGTPRAVVVATGSVHAPGIGGTDTDVTIEDASSVTASGGTGAAGIGGGTGGDGGSLAVEDTAQVDATAGSGSDVSAVGAGSGGSATGDTTIAAGAKLTTHGDLRIPAGATVTNTGELVLDGTASGAGSLQNDGKITGTTAGIDADLDVFNHNYKVVLDQNVGSTGTADSSAPAFRRYYGPSLGTTLDAYAPAVPHKKLVGWATSDNSISTVGSGSRALPAGSTDGEPVTLTLAAVYKDKITSTAPAAVRLRNGDAVPANSYIHGDDIATYTVDPATPLPAGVTFTNGVFGGTPTTNGTTDVTVNVTGPYDAAPVALAFHFVVAAVPVVTSTSTAAVSASTDLLPVTNGVAYSDHLTASGDGTLSYTKVSGTLPQGLTFTNGVIAGTANDTAGTYSIVVTATSDLYGDSAQKTIVLHLGDAPAVTSTDTDLGKATVGEAYGSARGHLTASGTTDLDAVTFSKTGGELPAGLTISSNGTFSGSVDSGATAKTYAFEVTAHTRYGSSTATVLHLVVGKAPVITTGTPAPLTIGTAYTGSAAIQLADGGTGTAIYSAPSADLPSGLSLSGTGVLSGTLTAPASGPSAHSYTFLVTATNDFGTRTRSYTVVTGQAPAITTSSLPNASVGGLYEKSIAVTGDDLAHATYSLIANPASTRQGNAVPDGLSIDSTGLISGSIADVGTSDLRIRVHTVFGDAFRNLTLVADQGAGLIMHDLAPVTVGEAYSTTVANGGSGVTYSVTTGTASLGGLSLNTTTGALTGTLTAARSFDFTIQATNSFGTTRHRYQFEAGSVPVITAPTTAFGTGVLTHALSSTQHVTATGVGSTTATWTRTSGDLPHGITLDPQTGVLSGTFDQAGTSTFGLKATTAFGTSTEQQYTVVVGAAPEVATAALPDAEVGVAYSVPLAVTGDGTITVTVDGLPDGLSYDAVHGKIVGTPTVDGPVTVDVTVSSRFGTPLATSLQLAVAAAVPVPVITVPVPVVTTPAPVVTTPAPAPVVTTQAPAPVVTTPAPVKTTPAPVATTPAAPAPVVPAPVLPDAPKASAKLGHAFSLSVAASSTVAVTYSLKGALPKGLAFDAAKGLISGTPKQEGTYAVTVTAKSAAGTDVQAYTVVVPEQQELITTASSRVVPTMGSAFDVTVGGLLKGERWRITTNGKVLAHGTAAKAGSVVASVILPTTRADKTYEILVRGSRTVADPAKTASADFSVTAAVAKKSLKVRSSSSGVRIDRLAPREIVQVLIDGKKAASGRADADGRFVFTPKGLKAGKHSVVVTGGSADRAGKLTLKVKR